MSPGRAHAELEHHDVDRRARSVRRSTARARTRAAARSGRRVSSSQSEHRQRQADVGVVRERVGAHAQAPRQQLGSVRFITVLPWLPVMATIVRVLARQAGARQRAQQRDAAPAQHGRSPRARRRRRRRGTDARCCAPGARRSSRRADRRRGRCRPPAARSTAADAPRRSGRTRRPAPARRAPARAARRPAGASRARSGTVSLTRGKTKYDALGFW